MTLIYEENPIRTAGAVKTDNMDATKHYLTHYGNMLYLTFMLENGDRIERHQASKEMKICERKMAFWERHPNYDKTTVMQGIAKLKKDWGS